MSPSCTTTVTTSSSRRSPASRCNGSYLGEWFPDLPKWHAHPRQRTTRGMCGHCQCRAGMHTHAVLTCPPPDRYRGMASFGGQVAADLRELSAKEAEAGVAKRWAHRMSSLGQGS